MQIEETHFKKHTRHYFLCLFLLVAGVALGVRFWLFFHRTLPILAKQESYVGVIDADIEDKDRSQVFSLLIETEKSETESASPIRVRVYVLRFPHFAYGDRLKIVGNLSTPRSFKSDNGRTFDYEHFLQKDDIYYEIKNPQIEILGHDQGNPVVAILFHIKHKFLEHIKAVLGEPHASLAGGLAVGEKSALGAELIEDFRRAGLIHIVVLSGFNITIVATAIRKILSFLPRAAGIIIGGTMMVLFCMLVGGGATVIRSCIMGLIALVGELSYRRYSVKRALAFAAYLMLWHNPSILLYDPSFQLSFLATLSLILLASPIEKWLESIPRWLRLPERFELRGLVASTLATQIFVSPFIFYLMGQISIVGVFVNILVLPIIPLTMFVVTAIGLGGFFSTIIAKIFAFPAFALLAYELSVVRTASHLPLAVFAVASFPFTTMCVTYACFALGLYTISESKSVTLPIISSPRQNSAQSPPS